MSDPYFALAAIAGAAGVALTLVGATADASVAGVVFGVCAWRWAVRR